ncbi:hypothetical protein EVAR_77284_1 [Eumeta japonica]|uniref:Uncharacterized protein n=1 Tax=Eumeta variegata TaxID=151549 RepID=A0A4C1UM66_EUMVA|nr:hypothetical protein EVAR_77284_1 [Eumeta japonica]
MCHPMADTFASTYPMFAAIRQELSRDVCYDLQSIWGSEKILESPHSMWKKDVDPAEILVDAIAPSALAINPEVEITESQIK